MKYQIVDTIINKWAQSKKLLIQTSFKGEEVRSIEIVDKKGNRYQIWVEPTDNSGEFEVNVWDFGRNKNRFICNDSDIEKQLEQAYDMAIQWAAKK